MSIYRQLWLAIVGLTLLAFAGSFAVSVYTARKYIEQQLYMKNVDNASSLALVLSQLPSKDRVTVGLVISAQFDTGHYQEITLTDPKHRVLLEKRYTGTETGAPAWFEHMFPIQAAAGEALVQDGWRQYGAIRVLSHARFAYQALWAGVQELAAWFLLGGIAAGILGTSLLKILFRSLGRVVEQAQAIQERRFVTVPEPRTPELRSVVTAMNTMVAKLKGMFAEEAARLDELRRRVNQDPLTDLANRAYFMAGLRETLNGQHAPSGGSLALIRIAELDRLNDLLGHVRTDQLIRDIATTLRKLADVSEDRLAARLNGSDFALLAEGDSDPDALAREVCDGLNEVLKARWPELDDAFHVGVVPYLKGERPGDILGSSDKALAVAENQGPNSCHSLQISTKGRQEAMNSEAWRQSLTDALRDGRLHFERYPVLTAAGQPIHQEGIARLQLRPGEPLLPASEFMPMALRFKLSTTVDAAALEMALEHLGKEETDVAINLSAASIADLGFVNALTGKLRQDPTHGKRLWIEVPEYGVFRDFDAFKGFCLNLAPLGCRLGIEHFGHHVGQIARLAELGLDYLKIDGSFIHDIAGNSGNQEFLRGLCKTAHNVGLLVIAEGVTSEEERTTVIDLGFDGVTGQAVREGGAAA